jgi:hypothetical protein
MSMVYADAVESILNDIVEPALTLICVAKPWSVASPELVIIQSLGGSPGWVFSQATGFTTGGPHDPAAAAGSTWSATVDTLVIKTVANRPINAGNRHIRNMPNLPPSTRRAVVPVRPGRIAPRDRPHAA